MQLLTWLKYLFKLPQITKSILMAETQCMPECNTPSDNWHKFFFLNKVMYDGLRMMGIGCLFDYCKLNVSVQFGA